MIYITEWYAQPIWCAIVHTDPFPQEYLPEGCKIPHTTYCKKERTALFLSELLTLDYCEFLPRQQKKKQFNNIDGGLNSISSLFYYVIWYQFIDGNWVRT